MINFSHSNHPMCLVLFSISHALGGVWLQVGAFGHVWQITFVPARFG